MGASESRECTESATAMSIHEGKLTKVGGGKLVFQVVKGDLLAHQVDAIVLGACPDVAVKPGLRKAVHDKGGDDYDKAISAAKQQQGFQGHAGAVLSVDVSSVSGLPYSHVFMAVKTDEQHVKQAYKNVLTSAAQLGIKKLAMPGLGCGDLNLSPAISSARLCEVLKEMLQGTTNQLGDLEKIVLSDMQDAVVCAFWDAFKAADIKAPPAFNPAMYAKFAELVTDDADVMEDNCPVCLCGLLDDANMLVVRVRKCGHQMHLKCFQDYLRSGNRKCCTCTVFFDIQEGSQPDGATMTVNKVSGGVDGFSCTEHYRIDYHVPSGVQGAAHVRPGKPFTGGTRHAYLPCTPEGELVKRLLEKAFMHRLIFTVGDSLTSGAKNVVTWANIHHKTSLTGGATGFGYPDATYLDRVKDELAAVGITPDVL